MKQILNDQERIQLDRRVADVERRTGTQIVLAVIERSDTYAELPWKAFALGVAAAGLGTVLLDLLLPVWYRCLIAVELKIGRFKPEYAGKMQFYLDALDEKLKLDEENPSAGLILCKSKEEEVVRIATSKALTSVKVATYKTKIIDKKLLKRKLHSLPWIGEGIQ